MPRPAHGVPHDVAIAECSEYDYKKSAALHNEKFVTFGSVRIYPVAYCISHKCGYSASLRARAVSAIIQEVPRGRPGLDLPADGPSPNAPGG